MGSDREQMNVSVRLRTDKVDDLDDDAQEEGMSRAEYIRSLIESRHESDERVSELEGRVSDLESIIDEQEVTIERLQNEKRLILEREEETNELVEYVESQKSLTEQKAHAGILTRTKWFLTGVPEE